MTPSPTTDRDAHDPATTPTMPVALSDDDLPTVTFEMLEACLLKCQHEVTKIMGEKFVRDAAWSTHDDETSLYETRDVPSSSVNGGTVRTVFCIACGGARANGLSHEVVQYHEPECSTLKRSFSIRLARLRALLACGRTERSP